MAIGGDVFTSLPVTIYDSATPGLRWRCYRLGPVSMLAPPTLGWAAPGTWDGGVGLWLMSEPGAAHRMEVSTDRMHWSTLRNLHPPRTPVPIRDAAATNPGQRFYRAVKP